ncbi:unnamed protein product, partial [Mesorhabditis belari]|uniref:Uncharacterized protein n=1 Tax=Mesorhabditis belari TaxID=2138241 RepID=A0AAF3F0N6_9BILA
MLWVILLQIFPLAFGGVLVGEKKNIGDEANREMYQNYAKEAVKKYNEQSNSLFTWSFVEVSEAHKQLVNGEQFTLYIVIAQTDCKKASALLQPNDCRQTNRHKKCTVQVHRRIWENYENVELLNCETPYHLKREEKKQKIASDFQADYVYGNKAKLSMDHGKIHMVAHIKPVDYSTWNMFADFMGNHEKYYSSKRETLHRFRVFKRNLQYAKMIQRREHGTAVYGITRFSDLTRDEFKQIYLPYNWTKPVYPNKKIDVEDYGVSLEDLPESLDWREKGAVTGVKDQKMCGSCWAFSTTGNVEGQWFIAKGQLVSLSEQELVDCDTLDQGCGGGLPSNAYKEIIRLGGMESEDSYPYDAKGETCHILKKDISVYINDSVELPHDEVQMQAWLATKGPISIAPVLTSLEAISSR